MRGRKRRRGVTPTGWFREPECTPGHGSDARLRAPIADSWDLERRDDMVPLLLWILGVPGLIIILLLLLGIVHL